MLRVIRLVILSLVVTTTIQIMPLRANSSAVVVGKIAKVQIIPHSWLGSTPQYDPNSLGVLTIYMDDLPPACGSSLKRVAIRSDHPAYESMLSTALSAKASDREIEVYYIDTCTVRSGAWDLGVIGVP